MRDLFSSLQNDHLPRSDWQPQAPHSLNGVKELELDCESNGLKWWDGDRPIGLSYCLPDGTTRYLPWGHRGGGNLDESAVKRWAQRELRNIHITNANTRFDVHMLREWGVDLEAQGCTVSDIQHHAGLLDDHRLRFNQEALVAEFLEGEAKVNVVDGHKLDGTRMVDYHAGIVAVRAEADVRQVQKLRKVFAPKILKEDLGRVLALENSVIYPVCEMEKNGALIDLELLQRWDKESEREFLVGCMRIYKECGVKFTGTTQDWVNLFGKLGIPITEFTEAGSPSFTDAVLKPIQHPIIKLARRMVRVKSLRSKYLSKYLRSIGSDGVLRYALHQLRASKDEWDEHAAGTISGRFSSTGLRDDEGVNIQQVMKVAKQRTMFGYEEEDDSHDDELYIIRQLHVPAPGHLHLSADAEQIEYRVFAGLAGTPAVLEAYRNEPRMNFHKFVHGMIKEYNASLTYRQQKDLNFAKIYGAGLVKLALMVGFITKTEFEELRNSSTRWSDPRLKPALEVQALYNRILPEVEPMLAMAKDRATKRGWVRTVMGRRSRFPGGNRVHKALNAVIQGTAADIMKMKLVELHKHRKDTGFLLRWTVHDEVDGDVPDTDSARRVSTILDQQSVPMKVPILWSASTGKNWKEAA